MHDDEVAEAQTASFPKGAIGINSGVLAGDLGAASLLGFQASAQRAYQRERAFNLAIQANGGKEISTADLLASADAILVWLAKDDAPKQ